MINLIGKWRLVTIGQFNQRGLAVERAIYLHCAKRLRERAEQLDQSGRDCLIDAAREFERRADMVRKEAAEQAVAVDRASRGN